MKPYELTYIISSEEKSEAAENLKKEVELFVQEKGGLIVKSEKTVPQSLAYPIKKHSSGFFVTLEFQAEEKEVEPLKEMPEKNPKILRHFIIVKNPIKQMKERRTRKPMTVLKDKPETTEVYKGKAKKEETEVKIEDIDKKLDEILSE
jgi:small subunit ribosomal protein S6